MFVLILQTFGMMALTFAIGFFVAAMISLMVRGAETSSLWNEKKDEIRRSRRIRSIRKRTAMKMLTSDKNELVSHYYGGKAASISETDEWNDLVKMFYGKKKNENLTSQDLEEITKHYHHGKF